MLRLTARGRARAARRLLLASVYTYFPLPPGLRAVVTMHDAIAERFPELTLPTRTRAAVLAPEGGARALAGAPGADGVRFCGRGYRPRCSDSRRRAFAWRWRRRRRRTVPRRRRGHPRGRRPRRAAARAPGGSSTSAASTRTRTSTCSCARMRRWHGKPARAAPHLVLVGTDRGRRLLSGPVAP